MNYDRAYIGIAPDHPRDYLPDVGKMRPVRNIQRLNWNGSRDNQVRFGDRFSCQYMGSTEFEVGAMGQRLRELDKASEIHEFKLDKLTVRVLFNPVYFDKLGVERVITKVYRDEYRLQERSEFTPRDFERRAQHRKDWGDYTQAWFEIDYGIFWTCEKMGMRDVQLNIRRSVAFMDLAREEREAIERREEEAERARKEAKRIESAKPSPERQRLIDLGVIRPSKVTP